MIQCAVGIVYNQTGQILISKRQSHKFGAGLWEFPGGKIEPNESECEALIRELKEEIDIEILSKDVQKLMCYSFDYPEYKVLLQVFSILSFEGIPISKEGQELVWVDPGELQHYTFLEGNKKILEILGQIPSQATDVK